MDETFTSFEIVLKNCMERIINKLGYGWRESVYQNALAHELRTFGYSISKEVNFPILYDGVEVGIARFDLLVNSQYVIEFKALAKIGEKEKNQIKRYLEVSSLNEGYLINVNLDKFEAVKVQPLLGGAAKISL